MDSQNPDCVKGRCALVRNPFDRCGIDTQHKRIYTQFPVRLNGRRQSSPPHLLPPPGRAAGASGHSMGDSAEALSRLLRLARPGLGHAEPVVADGAERLPCGDRQ